MGHQPLLAEPGSFTAGSGFLPSAVGCGAGWLGILEIPAPLPKLFSLYRCWRSFLQGCGWKLQQSGLGSRWLVDVLGGRCVMVGAGRSTAFFVLQAGARPLHAAAIAAHLTDRFQCRQPSFTAESFSPDVNRHPHGRFIGGLPSP